VIKRSKVLSVKTFDFNVKKKRNKNFEPGLKLGKLVHILLDNASFAYLNIAFWKTCNAKNLFNS